MEFALKTKPPAVVMQDGNDDITPGQRQLWARSASAAWFLREHSTHFSRAAGFLGQGDRGVATLYLVFISSITLRSGFLCQLDLPRSCGSMVQSPGRMDNENAMHRTPSTHPPHRLSPKPGAAAWRPCNPFGTTILKKPTARPAPTGSCADSLQGVPPPF
jgi:hypothetical protein